MMYSNAQYLETCLKQITAENKKIDDVIAEKKKKGELTNDELMKLNQQRFLAPLFDGTFGSFERFRSPW